jgi:hypothetical protein
MVTVPNITVGVTLDTAEVGFAIWIPHTTSLFVPTPRVYGNIKLVVPVVSVTAVEVSTVIVA